MRKSNGFTLVELLIVVAILSILSSFAIYSFSSVQQKGRDGRRKSDLTQVAKTLEMAKADCIGSAYYPYIGTSTDLPLAKTNYTNLGTYLTNTNLKYIGSMPVDPKNSGDQIYSFFTVSPATSNVCQDTDGDSILEQGGVADFVLAVKLERSDDADSTTSRTKCSGKPGIGSWNFSGYFVVCNT